VDCEVCTDAQEALVIHRNAPLTPVGRLRPAPCAVVDGQPLRQAAERFQVNHTTASRRAGRAEMEDRSSRPRHRPRRTSAAVEEQVLRLRHEHRIGPQRLAARTGAGASTARRVPSLPAGRPRG
jgi:transposase